MRRVSSAELVRSFSVHTDAALAEPIVITRNGRDRLVILNVDLYRDILALAPCTKARTPASSASPRSSGALGRRRGACAGGEEAQGLILRRADRRWAVSRTLWVTRFKAAFHVVS